MNFDGGIKQPEKEMHVKAGTGDYFFSVGAYLISESLNYREAVRRLDEIKTWVRANVNGCWGTWASQLTLDGPGTTRIYIGFENESDAVMFYMGFA